MFSSESRPTVKLPDKWAKKRCFFQLLSSLSTTLKKLCSSSSHCSGFHLIIRPFQRFFGLEKMYRSTKGASKARRDQINAEIRSLKELLPISDADKARLSYLHIMSLACIYTRKSVFFSQAAAGHGMSGSLLSLPELSDLLHTLPGFLLVLTSEGKLLYLSDNVAEHLGHSMVDLVAQSDSVYDIIDPVDHFIMRGNLVPITTPDTDRLFRCRFSTSKFVRRQGSGNKQAIVRARCLPPPYHASPYWTSNPVWVCFCSPLEASMPQLSTSRNPLPTPPAEQSFLLSCFQSQHSRDMRIHTVQDSVSVYLGYDIETLRSRSWYSLIHPRDLSHASAQHCTLLHNGGERQVEMVVQVEAADHSWIWLYIVLQLETGEYPINSHNYVISESEAWSVRQQLHSEQNQLALLYQESRQSSDPLSSPDQVFTPSSSGLSSQSFDFSFITSGRSSSEELPGTSAPSSMTFDPLEGEEIDPQSHGGGHQMWRSAMTIAPEHLSNINLSTVPQSQVAPPPLPPFKAPPKRQRSEEFICTPPYTPRLSGGSFIFNDETLRPSDHSKSAKMRQSITSATNIGPAQPCRKRLYETLPPTPDSPGSDECILMALPEIRGPLYVDVPHLPFHAPPEGLLTPEASPTKKPCLSFFPREDETERERMEISLLAQYISTLAEGFCHNHPQGASAPPHHANSSLAHIDVLMFEEKAVDDIPLPNLPSPSPVPPSPYSSVPSYSQCRSSPVQEEAAVTLIGVNHLCSVQLTHCNRMTEGGLQDGERPDEDMEMMSSQRSSEAPALTPALPCAQSLLEELVTMEPVFGAAVPMTPADRQQDELYQLPHQGGPQMFYQDGTGDHMF
ncbi:neuronal PAS domain-containing protein 4B [Danio rerio]|uniref:Neuronal PAS domain-containing protein 4B n=2 Tax=Danio rerio TaxID=7955 RepID=NPS4B_DANRE|nr:neuronal PAS domain-containing protein 4B [Danio rerio]E7FFX1.1 RecName: Full=Neuronal PAS domain-containing protein 4B [Danio rerio]|eukprot:XP_009293710.2 neuronal PAS domain-containing protein 4B [Danio rerio]